MAIREPLRHALLAAAGLAAVCVMVSPARADWGGYGRGWHHDNDGDWRHRWHGYAPPPAYYYPPPVVYAPRPYYYAPSPYYAPPRTYFYFGF